MLGTSTSSISHGQLPKSSSAAVVGKGSASQYSGLNSPALSVDSSGSSTVRGAQESRRDNRWSGSSLSRSNSDSSTVLKTRGQHAHSASVPHIVNIRGGEVSTKAQPPIPPQKKPTIIRKQQPSNSSNPNSGSEKVLAAAERPPPPPPNNTQSRGGTRQHRSPSQRAMLSSALQKANTAVFLDNANNIEGAMEAYTDTCSLIQQAMARAAVPNDKVQLQSIHDTYVSRIEQLKSISPRPDLHEKELPPRPLTQEFIDGIESIREEDDEEESVYYGDAELRDVYNAAENWVPRNQPASVVPPPRRDSLFVPPNRAEGYFYNNHNQNQPPPVPLKISNASRINLPSPIAESYKGDDIFERNAEKRASLDADLLVSGGGGNNQVWPTQVQTTQEYVRRSSSTGSTSSRVSSKRLSSNLGHSRGGSEVSTSWLNTIDESGGSVSGDSTFEGREWGKRHGFEDELDAAVEAAYGDDDEEGDGGYNLSHYEVNGLVVMKSSNVWDESKPEDAEGSMEASQIENQKNRDKILDTSRDFFDDNIDEEDEEEERMLDDMTRGFLLDDFEFELEAKAELTRDPRESSSSSMSASTWVSSVASKKSSLMSHGYQSGTTLQSVAEFPTSRPPSVPPPPPPNEAPPLPPPPQVPPKSSFEKTTNGMIETPVLPPVELASTSPIQPIGSPARNSPANGSLKGSGVRSRRLSGLTAGPLIIDTDTSGPVPPVPSTVPVSRGSTPQPPIAAPPNMSYLNADAVNHNGLHTELDSISASQKSSLEQPPPVPLKTPGTIKPFPPSPLPNTEGGYSLSPMPYPLTALSNDSPTPRSGSPARFASKISNLPGLRQIGSSASLKNLNKASNPDSETTSPITPGIGSLLNNSSTTNLRSGKMYAMGPTPPTPGGMVPMTPTMNYSFQASAALSTSGLHLFDSKLHSPTTPGSPSSLIQNPPTALEPCPTEPHSRPYWLMRCLYQTIAHPRGGYLSARLFVPRDVWLMKGIKIKAVDDKISACDLVSAALAKLAIIREGDVGAIFEEMQSLENVLDRAQTMLSKKLGNEVGPAGAMALYGSSLNGDHGGNDAPSKPIGSTGKSYLSWRKLRSKNSNSALASSYTADPVFESANFPMASPRAGNTSEASRQPERNLKSVSFTGPNASYIAALARLFDAAQVLDRHVPLDTESMSRQTQVGLQLSQRHASEFFGLFICRFVLADVTLLLDKFLKKGTEWVGS